MKDFFIGIDWADQSHEICVIDDGGAVMAEFCIPHSCEGISGLVEEVKRLAASAKEISIGIETSHGLLVAELLDAGFKVYPINPQAASEYRKSLKVSRVKTDRFDAFVLAHMLRSHRHQLYAIKSDSLLVKKLKIITRDYKDLEEEKNAITNKLRDCLKRYYPVALKVFCKLDQPVTLLFLKKHPFAKKARGIKKKELLKFLQKAGYTRTDKIDTIWDKLKGEHLQCDDELAFYYSRKMLTLVKMLEELLKGQNEILEEMKALLKKHPDSRIFLSLPGAAEITAASMIAEIGDNREKFDSASALQTLSGTAPVTRGSGGYYSVIFRRACIKPFRKIMQQFAGNSLRTCFWAREYYNNQLAKGKSHQKALRSLANKWLRIIYKLWVSRTLYDETTHLFNQNPALLKKAA